MNHAIYPCLWFADRAREAVDWYCSLFPRSEVRAANPSATTFTLNGTKLMADPDRADRVRDAYLGMQKLDLNTLLTA